MFISNFWKIEKKLIVQSVVFSKNYVAWLFSWIGYLANGYDRV